MSNFIQMLGHFSLQFELLFFFLFVFTSAQQIKNHTLDSGQDGKSWRVSYRHCKKMEYYYINRSKRSSYFLLSSVFVSYVFYLFDEWWQISIKTWIEFHHLVGAFMEHFIQWNISLRYQINAKPLLLSWQKSANKEVNDWSLYIMYMQSKF